MGSQEAARYGVYIEKNERYDPWLGFTLNTDLKPEIYSDAEALAFAAQMKQDSDPCARLAARLIERDKLDIHFKPFEDPPAEAQAEPHNAEGYYYHLTIFINSKHDYMRARQNLKKRIIHESFHRVQEILGIGKSDKDTHNYGHRPIIIKYLEEQFPQEGACELSEVPEAARNKVEDRLHLGGDQVGLQAFPMDRGERVIDPQRVRQMLSTPNFDQSNVGANSGVLAAPSVAIAQSTPPKAAPSDKKAGQSEQKQREFINRIFPRDPTIYSALVQRTLSAMEKSDDPSMRSAAQLVKEKKIEVLFVRFDQMREWNYSWNWGWGQDWSKRVLVNVDIKRIYKEDSPALANILKDVAENPNTGGKEFDFSPKDAAPGKN